MIRQVLPDIFLIEVPLPGIPLKATNSYLIKGQDRCLLVDTGLPLPVCKTVLVSGIEQLGVALQDLDYFLTHMHGDHAGLVHDMIGVESRVYCSATDAEIFKNGASTDYFIDYFNMHGFPPLNQKEYHMLNELYIPDTCMDYTFVTDGDVISAGKYNLLCVMTPGHTPGHVCLYEPEHKFLLGGDLILQDVSPNIMGWPDREDSLELYLQSLEKIRKLDISLLLPGHRNPIVNIKQRINQLMKSHKNRLANVLAVLDQGTMNAYQIARKMNWDVDTSWDEFPRMQQVCATGEAVSHLEYLAHRSKVQVKNQNGCLFFSLMS